MLYAGRQTREKGVELLADAFLIAHARDPRLHLSLAGGGPEQAYLRQRLGAQEENGPDDVVLVPIVDTAQSYRLEPGPQRGGEGPGDAGRRTAGVDLSRCHAGQVGLGTQGSVEATHAVDVDGGIAATRLS